MTIDELMSQILDVLPEAVFGEDMTTGEVVIATGFSVDKKQQLVRIEE
jgi:hypothetical protein